MDDETRAALPAMMEARGRFMELIAEVRPELHRYCARMTGSVFDGEDVVQDTLAKAYYALSQMTEAPNFKPWLFRIAHNNALDFLKRYERKYVDFVPQVPEPASVDETAEVGIDPALVEAALSVFADLPPLQRAALILKDVLGHSLVEIANTLEMSVGAVKAALSRARANIARTPHAPLVQPTRSTDPQKQAMLRRYADLFNDRNWDGLRGLLREDTRLDIVSRVQQRAVIAGYYDRYAKILETEDIRAEVGFVDGVPAIAMFRPASSTLPAYFVLLESENGRLSLIRDFRYIPYIAERARFSQA
jgi:RNA polymerase sigma-70 factor (ECF subfamily)